MWRTKKRRLHPPRVMLSRSKIRVETKIVSEYENAQEYKPRKKSMKRSASEKTADEDLKVETIPEEEATKIVVEGTHEYPTAPGICLSSPLL